jgi:Protein of unknown function (DUF1397)
MFSAFAAINTTNLSINDLKNALPTGVTLPPELEGVDIPQVDDVKKLFKEKCITVSGSDSAYQEADVSHWKGFMRFRSTNFSSFQQASTVLMECVQKLVNVSTISEEIEKAKPNGNLDTVFNKYCDKRSDALECVDAFTSSLDPCLTEEERDQKKVFTNITKSLLEFVCHENGNQIARKDFSLPETLAKFADDVFLHFFSVHRRGGTRVLLRPTGSSPGLHEQHDGKVLWR